MLRVPVGVCRHNPVKRSPVFAPPTSPRDVRLRPDWPSSSASPGPPEPRAPAVRPSERSPAWVHSEDSALSPPPFTRLMGYEAHRGSRSDCYHRLTQDLDLCYDVAGIPHEICKFKLRGTGAPDVAGGEVGIERRAAAGRTSAPRYARGTRLPLIATSPSFPRCGGRLPWETAEPRGARRLR
ncbi:hypothetical protein SKAU_G00119930 [Synaphobranchus kaupii]|uniref:Uncharacterized protein n=1 Tax=Synaphobranchus kaupii TaxID=118154 RepID=A0A9Q1FP63_SYNKA|nr:hypothetical protein SKAU_G00119930 [Synaphobranchus kaupii]